MFKVAKKPETFKMKLVFFFRYLADTGCYVFLPTYFLYLSRAYGWETNNETWRLALLGATIPFMAIVGNIVAGHFAGKERKNINILRLVIPIEIAALISLGAVGATIGYRGNMYVLLVIFSLIANAFDMTMYTLIDAMASDVVQAEGGSFRILESSVRFRR